MKNAILKTIILFSALVACATASEGKGSLRKVASSTETAEAEDSPHHRRLLDEGCVRLYTGTDYKGDHYILCRGSKEVGIDFTNDKTYYNDKISSIRVGSKVTVKVYEHGSYGGSSKVFYKDVKDLRKVTTQGRSNWNDAISGIKVTNIEPSFGPDCVRLYLDGRYQGKHYTTCGKGKSIDFASHIESWNDKISSIKVGKNVAVRVYEHGDYKGHMAVFHNDVGSLGSKDMKRGTNWNDQISSIKVVDIDSTPHCAIEVRDNDGGVDRVNQELKYRCKINKSGQSCRIQQTDLPEDFNYSVLTLKSHICICKVSVGDGYFDSSNYQIAPFAKVEPNWGGSYYRSFAAECWLKE